MLVESTAAWYCGVLIPGVQSRSSVRLNRNGIYFSRVVVLEIKHSDITTQSILSTGCNGQVACPVSSRLHWTSGLLQENLMFSTSSSITVPYFSPKDRAR